MPKCPAQIPPSTFGCMRDLLCTTLWLLCSQWLLPPYLAQGTGLTCPDPPSWREIFSIIVQVVCPQCFSNVLCSLCRFHAWPAKYYKETLWSREQKKEQEIHKPHTETQTEPCNTGYQACPAVLLSQCYLAV